MTAADGEYRAAQLATSAPQISDPRTADQRPAAVLADGQPVGVAAGDQPG